MTLQEAAHNIGRAVAYQSGYSADEYGTIANVNDEYVMVLYVKDNEVKATRPEDLIFLFAADERGDSIDDS